VIEGAGAAGHEKNACDEDRQQYRPGRLRYEEKPCSRRKSGKERYLHLAKAEIGTGLQRETEGGFRHIAFFQKRPVNHHSSVSI
jgi:hypothetical protein